MKKILTIALLAISFTCKSQVTEVVPINTVFYQNGAYLKDLDDTYLPYVGTWKGTLDNKEYTFVFVKFTQKLTGNIGGNYHYTDELMIKYQVRDLITNQILYSDLNINDYNNFKIMGASLMNGVFTFWYENKTPNYCQNSIIFKLTKINGQPSQLKFGHLWYDYYDPINCPYADQQSIPSFIPKSEMIFIKQ